MISLRILCLMGPTATGKTNVAIELTQNIPCDIISVDSSMVYRGMDIGTAKPTFDEQKIVPHRLIDIRDPGETYSAGDFRQDAIREIEDILAHDRIPLLVGGTMLYFKVLQQGLAELPTADKEIRKKIEDEAKEVGWPELHKRLDPKSSERIKPNDSQRIQRALEIQEITGKTMTQLLEEQKQPPLPYKFVNLALMSPSREILHERIVKRFDQMLKNGFIEEVERLIEKKHNPGSVGYNQVCQYLAGRLTYEEMREKAIIATRQLAKRQMTWLRSWPDVKWFDSEDPKIVEKILQWIK